MNKILVTGSGGLIGSETALYFGEKGHPIIGVDNDMRSRFFGPEASTRWNVERLKKRLGARYTHIDMDIRDLDKLGALFKEHGSGLHAIIHTAAQPSHDWAAREPFTDFSVNAQATLYLLEMTRQHCPKTPFIFMSTNKVYGDTPNRLPLIEKEKRWEIDPSHPYHKGIDENMSLDHCKHSLFGASKVAADVMTQEYGRYFGVPTVCFRGGCLTGPNHSGTALHGFLSYLMKCAVTGDPYTAIGYKGKQVRDNIHSYDIVRMFDEFIQAPRPGEVYNAGGARFSNCSLMEARELCEKITGRKMNMTYTDTAREGDHIWYISDVSKFQSHYPNWKLTYNIDKILVEIFEANKDRWMVKA